MNTRPSGLVIAGAAIGSTVASVTGRSPYSSTSSGRSRSGAEAAGTSSRRAIHSGSSASPSNGRGTKTSRTFSARGAVSAAAGSFDACSRRHSLEPPRRGGPPWPRAHQPRRPSRSARRARSAGATRSGGVPARVELGPDALPQAVPVDAPAAGQAGDDVQAPPVRRVRAGGPHPGPGARRRRRSPGAGPRPSAEAGRSRQATRTTPPGSGSACRTALPTSSARTAIRSARSVGGTTAGQLVGEPVPGQPCAGGVVGHHHAPRPIGRRCPAAHRRLRVGHPGQPRGSRTSATVPPPVLGRRDTHPFCCSTIRRTR